MILVPVPSYSSHGVFHSHDFTTHTQVGRVNLSTLGSLAFFAAFIAPSAASRVNVSGILERSNVAGKVLAFREKASELEGSWSKWPRVSQLRPDKMMRTFAQPFPSA